MTFAIPSKTWKVQELHRERQGATVEKRKETKSMSPLWRRTGHIVSPDKTRLGHASRGTQFFGLNFERLNVDPSPDDTFRFICNRQHGRGNK